MSSRCLKMLLPAEPSGTDVANGEARPLDEVVGPELSVEVFGIHKRTGRQIALASVWPGQGHLL